MPVYDTLSAFLVILTQSLAQIVLYHGFLVGAFWRSWHWMGEIDVHEFICVGQHRENGELN
jgi:hypothetical protein